MHICMFTKVFPTTTETFVFEPVNWLRERGHEVSVVADSRGVLPRTADGGAPSRVVGNWHSRSQKTKLLLRAPFATAKGILRSRDRRGYHGYSRAELITRSVLPEVRLADCLFAHFGPTGLKWLPIAALARRPYAVYFHGYDATRLVRDNPTIWDPLFRSGAALLTNSDYLKQRLHTAGAPQSRVFVVRLAPSPTLVLAVGNSDLSSRQILTIGRLVEKKGIADSIRAFAKAQDILQGRWEYRIVGDGVLRPELKTLVEDLAITRLVHLVGVQTRPHLARTLGQSSIFCLASKTAHSGDTEGTPVSIIEAAAVGLPVIATNHAGIPELLPGDARDRGYLVGEGDIDALAAAMRKLGSDIEERGRWGICCREYVRRNFTADRHVDSLTNTLREEARVPRA